MHVKTSKIISKLATPPIEVTNLHHQKANDNHHRVRCMEYRLIDPLVESHCVGT